MTDFVNYVMENQLGEIAKNVDMRDHTYIQIGSTVNIMFFPNDLNSLSKAYKFICSNNLRYLVMGRGSNCVFPDEEMEVIIIKISNVMDFLEITNDSIYVGAGYSMTKLARTLSKQGFSGLEFAGGIPGALGGAIYMNAGAHTGEIANLIIDVQILTSNGEIKSLSNIECNFAYRMSIFQTFKCIIVSANFKINLEDKAAVYKKMSGNLEYRKEMQPLEYPSCGSSFRNPPGHHAGKLIEEVGLKGYTIGGAKVSTKHANFIINNGNASAEDVEQLVMLIQEKVFEKTSIKLHPEMEFVRNKYER